MSGNALLIVNPWSGKKNGEAIAASVRTELAEHQISSTVFISHSLEKLDAFIRETDLNQFTTAGIIGGDGSMHEFLNAVLKHHPAFNLPIALFPCGTGNAFNFDIGCSTVEMTLDCIFSQSISWIDVAEVRYADRTLWSFNILGCGLVAEINKMAEKLRIFGGARYTIASVIKLLANPVNAIEVKTDSSEWKGDFSFVLACNTRYTGKGMMMAPNAKLADGKFDILLVKSCSRWKLLKLFPKIFKGQHIGAEVLIYEQSSSLSISSAKNLITNIDGEIKGETPLSFTVHRNKIRAFVKSI